MRRALRGKGGRGAHDQDAESQQMRWVGRLPLRIYYEAAPKAAHELATG